MASISIDNLGKHLSSATESLISAQSAINEKAIRATYISIANKIIMKTPVDKGRARANWFLTKGQPSNKTTDSKNANARVSEVNRKLSGDILGETFYLTNNLPYIGVLEFGGYPKNPKKGTRVKKGKGKFEIRSQNGFSKQAPEGMVRLSVARFAKELKRNIRVYSK